MTAEQNPTLCAAWLGYALDTSAADVMVRICAWCPDKEAAEREAKRLCVKVTHGICKTCAGRQLELLTNE